MELSEFWSKLTAAEKRDLARRCETSVGHIANVALFGKRCGEKLAVCLERETKGEVVCESLRPDVDWRVLRNSAKSVTRKSA